MVMVDRNPFARSELHREIVDTSERCDWCGLKRGSTGKLFKYSTQNDGGSRFTHKGHFCSKGCHDNYHG